MSNDPLGTEKTIVRDDKAGDYALAAGQTLGQYRIIRPLGRGGMGEVYEVEHGTLERRYALKLLPADFAAQPGALERFRREAKVMANLEHPNILRVDDFGETEGRYWLRMELAAGVEEGRGARCEGGGQRGEVRGTGVSLQDLAEAKGGRIPQEKLVGILKQILEGLAYAHGHGAIHRDLKPSNILFSGGTVKIADFGLVRLVGEEWVRSQAQISVQRSMSMGDLKTIQAGSAEGTSTRSMLGTYEYMSPEQKRGAEATERSDLYAVGLMAFKLLTGQNPGVKPPSKIVRGLAAGWDDFVEKALEESATERWPDAKAMQGGLNVIGQAVQARQAEQIAAANRAEGERRAKAEAERQGRIREEARQAAEALQRREEDHARQADRPPQQASPPAPKGSLKWIWVLLVLAGIGVATWMATPKQVPAHRNPTAPTKLLARSTAYPDLQSPFKNSLGMELVPVAGLEEVLFCKWETRVQDYELYAREKGVDWPKPDFEQGPTHPAVNVSWDDAQKFCQWLTKKERATGKIGPDQRYRLPADWEWSVAVGLNEAREGTPQSRDCKDFKTYPWNRGKGTWTPTGKAGNYCGQETSGDAGDMIDGYTDGYRRTSPVGSFDANANGLYDLGGNVWEWCEDFYDGKSGSRVLRGASWGNFPPRFLLSSFRDLDDPVYRFDYYGFRVVLSR